MEIIEVIDAGLLSTVQDLGRFRYQRYGVPVSVAADPFALRVANQLVGNPAGAAGLECTLVGPGLRFLATTVMAVTGADLSPTLDGEAVAMWEPVVAPAESMLVFGDARDGVRGYLAIHGGIDVPLVLGSRSTHVRSKLGGFGGRAIQAGDFVAAVGDAPPSRVEGRRLPPEHVPAYGRRHVLRVVLGPQDGAFTESGIRTFLSSSYCVSGQSDRIGCRLQGPVIEHATSPDIVSDGIPYGAVQVAGDGMPIVLLVDRGTTGGYTKIATVISVDLPRLAQAGTGDTVTFVAATVHEAHRLLRQREEIFQRLAAGPPIVFGRRRFVATVDGERIVIESDLEEAAGRSAPDAKALAAASATAAWLRRREESHAATPVARSGASPTRLDP
jgi:antagonist of KipI